MPKTKLKLKDKSTQSKGEYIFYHILYGIIIAYDSYYILPVVIPITAYNNSTPRLAACMLATGIFGILISYSYNRNGKGVVQDIISGIGLYLILTVGKYAPVFVRWLVVGLMIISAIGIISIVSKKIERQDRIKQVRLSRFLRSTQLLRRNIGVAAAIAIMVLQIGLEDVGIQNVTETSGTKQELGVYETYGDEYMLERNIDTIKLIRDNDTFQTLDYNRKCEVLRAICYCEARYLGLCKINIVFKDIEDESLLGAYNHSTKTITINAKIVKDGSLPGGTAEELLVTVVHECRHCYQKLLSEMYINATPQQRNLLAFTDEGVNKWVDNMEAYKSGNTTIVEKIEYYSQPVEIDARAYSQAQVPIYYSDIDRILSEEMSE